MGGRPAKPIDLHLANGNRRHLTKEEIVSRKEQEGKLKSGVKTFKASNQVMQDPAALNMFKKLKKLYKNIEYVEGLDENIINRYCLLCSQEEQTLDYIALLNDELDNAKEFEERLEIYGKIEKANSILSKIRDMLLKLEDRLLLNPTARIKNVPKKEKPKAGDPNADLFD